MTHPQAQAPLNMPDPEVRERTTSGGNGWPIAIVSIVAILAGLAMTVWSVLVFVDGSTGLGFVLVIGGPLVVLIASFVAAGLTPVAPGESRVLQLFGHYKGTIRRQGLRWVNPLTMRRKVSTRIRNHETEVAKVNDLDGNPIEIAAVVVWQVEDTAMAVFEVDDFTEFVAIQTETAVRHIANGYPYDAHEAGQMSLRDNAEEITLRLSEEIGDRVESAGVRIIESRITHLAYAPEIAQAMLRRQQAGAVVAARQRIVQGAVGMVESALAQLSEDNVVELDEERKAAMVSNMLVVLCSEHSTQPVINTGSLYQ